MKKGDIVFVQGKGIISRFIRLIDNGKFSHVAIAISESEVIEADVDTRVAIRTFDSSKYTIIEVVDLGISQEQRDRVYYSALDMLGVKYDYFQLLWYGLRKLFNFKGDNKFNNPRHVICSELVFIVLEEIGVLEDLGIKEGLNRGIDLTPNELYDLVKFVSCK